MLYLGGYVALRVGHVVMHYHDMEGDYVGAAMGSRVPGLVVFSPLMWLEEKLWRLRR